MRYEVVGLHATWQIYQQLFRRSQARSEFLRESAADFFQIIHDSLSNDIEIALSRLGDPASTRVNKEDKPNATLRRLLDHVASLDIKPLTTELRRLLDVYNHQCSAIRIRRNKLLAHADLGALIRKYAEGEPPLLNGPLSSVTPLDLEQAFATLREFMNTFERHFEQSETAYEHIVMHEDGDAVVHLLAEGKRYDELLRDDAVEWDDLRKTKYWDV